MSSSMKNYEKQAHNYNGMKLLWVLWDTARDRIGGAIVSGLSILTTLESFVHTDQVQTLTHINYGGYVKLSDTAFIIMISIEMKEGQKRRLQRFFSFTHFFVILCWFNITALSTSLPLAIGVLSGASAGYVPVFSTAIMSNLFFRFVVVSEIHYFVIFRWLMQIHMDLLWQRPSRKPPWNQYIAVLTSMLRHSQRNISPGNTSFSTRKQISETSFITKTLVRKCWYQCVFSSEFHCDTSGFKMCFVQRMFSQKMLHTNHIRERSNMKMDNNRYYDRLASKTTLRKASSNSLLMYFLSIWLIHMYVINVSM